MFSKTIIFYYCLIISDLGKSQNWRNRRPLVHLRQGYLEGTTIFTDSGNSVNAFLGVPFAAPPIGNLRFAPPQEHLGWNGTKQAINYGSRCPQLPFKPGVTDQEDCLFLNIWTPENGGLHAPMPVVIFFEGEDFYRSSETPISGQDLAAEGIVIVTINYRLNVFGFLCLGSSISRGNLGLLDQYFGILWVKENIKQFGGDSEKITLYGHFSGGTSVIYHMVSPRTAGLFQRIIISHGNSITPWLISNDPVMASRQISRILGCDGYMLNQLDCLRSKNVEYILQALEEYSENYSWNERFLPVVDTFLPESNRYLPLHPNKVLKDGTFLQVPILTGISKAIANPQYLQWLDLASQGYDQLQQYIEKAKIPEITRLYHFPLTSIDQINELIKWKYFTSHQGDTKVLFDELKNLEFEAKTEAPHYLQILQIVSSYIQPIYVYFIDDIGFVPNSTDSLITSDLLLIFGPVLLKQVGRRRFTQHEMNLSRMAKQFWINFINFGNPTPNNQIAEWQKYTTGNNYIENLGSLNPDSFKLDKFRLERINFWNYLLPKLSNSKNNLSNYIPKELQNSPDPAAGFRHAMYTLIALVIVLLMLLLICIVLLKRRSKGNENLHMAY